VSLQSKTVSYTFQRFLISAGVQGRSEGEGGGGAAAPGSTVKGVANWKNKMSILF